MPSSITPTSGNEETSSGAVTSTYNPMPSEAVKEDSEGAAVTFLTSGCSARKAKSSAFLIS